MNGLVLQCGGPSAVVNASLAAVAQTWPPSAGRLWGARLGIQGLVQGDWVDLTALPAGEAARLAHQPGAALGSGRYRLDDAALPGVLDRLHLNGVRQLFCIGGNGTMAAAAKLLAAAQGRGQPLAVVGIPKTVDNDLAGTDVAPGYGSAARFLAQTARDISLDLFAMSNFDDVVALEVMGRHVGWLAAAAALARSRPGDPPHILLLPEAPVDEERLLDKIAAVHSRLGVCLVVAAEGARDAAGLYLAEKGGAAELDPAGQRMLGLTSGVASYLAGLVQARLGLRCRQLRPDTIQRSSRALAAPEDRRLAELAGRTAVQAAAKDASGVMVSLHAAHGNWTTALTPLEQVIGVERSLPPAYIADGGLDVTPAFVEYARAVAGPLEVTPAAYTLPWAAGGKEAVFIGLDLAWGRRNPSGGAVIRGGRLVEWSGSLGGDDEILAFVARHLPGHGPVVVGIDAPLCVPNAEGARPCDRAVTAAWGRQGGGAYPANRTRLAEAGEVRGETLAAALAERWGFVQTAPIPRQAQGRLVCEVYPHPAHLELFRRTRAWQVRPRPGRTAETRRAELAAYAAAMQELEQAETPLAGLDALATAHVASLRGRSLKELEDILDAVTCVYVVYYAWRHGPERQRLYGDLRTGHILIPRAG